MVLGHEGSIKCIYPTRAAKWSLERVRSLAGKQRDKYNETKLTGGNVSYKEEHYSTKEPCLHLLYCSSFSLAPPPFY
jgi:hypothetical protein